MNTSQTAWFLIIGHVVCTCFGYGTVVSARPALRAWSIRDSVELRYFSVNQYYAANWPASILPGGPIYPSPDGSHFFVISHAGNLDQNEVSYTMRIFCVDAIETALRRNVDRGENLKPIMEATYVTKTNSPGISAAEWSTDGTGVVFLGNTTQGQQVYYADVKRREISQLSFADLAVEQKWYGGGSLVYKVRGKEIPQATYPGYSVISQSGLLREESGVWERFSTSSYFACRHGKQTVAIRTAEIQDGKYVFSPNGNRCIVSARRMNPYRISVENLNWNDGSFSPLVDRLKGERIAVAGTNNLSPVWTDDPDRVILFNLEESAACQGTGAAMVGIYDFKEGRIFRIAPAIVESDGASWAVNGAHMEGGSINLHYAHKGEEMVFTIVPVGSGYSQPEFAVRQPQISEKQTTVGAGLTTWSKDSVRVFVNEGPNQPSEILAEDGAELATLIGADPRLSEIDWARVREIEWIEEDGRMQKGGLLLPPQSVAGPLPLVIQAQGYSSNHFLPDGDVSGAFAAQSLVARGIAVARIRYVDGEERERLAQENPTIATRKECGTYVKRIDAVIAKLANERLIDPKRVGLMGFSRAGYQVLYTLTHPGEFRLAAAVTVDSFTGGYANYLAVRLAPLFYGHLGLESIASDESVAGGSFWEKPSEWLAYETTFNMHRVRTPLMAMNHGMLWPGYELIGAAKRTGVPLYYLHLPKSSHQLYLPLEMSFGMTATVDWMAHWLLGEAPGDAIRANDFAKLRESYELLLKRPVPPAGKWVFHPEKT